MTVIHRMTVIYRAVIYRFHCNRLRRAGISGHYNDARIRIVFSPQLHQIQNKINDIIANYVIRHLVSDIRGFFSIM